MVARTFVYERQVEYWTSRQIEEFFLNAGFDIVVYPVEQGTRNAAANLYGSIRSDLESRGLAIGAMDMLIAAHALSLGVTLVSNNVRECSRIANLSLENWAE